MSVREATQALAFLGIIDAAPRRGLTIGHFSMERTSKYLGFHFAVSDFPLSSLIDTRIIIESGGLRRTSVCMQDNPKIYDELKAINDRLRQVEDVESWIEGDLAFHRTLARASGLDALVAFLDLLQVFFQRFKGDFPKSSWPGAIEGHQQIIDALRDGDPERAAELLNLHISDHRGRVVDG